MAIVAQPENRVDPRGTSRVPLQAAEFSGGEIIAGGVAKLGKSIANYAETQNEIDIVYAQTAAQKTRTEALRRVGEIRSRVSQATGLDAERDRQKAVEEIETIERESITALKDPLAQRMFSDSFKTAIQSDVLRMREHADQQLRVAENAEADSAIDLAVERSVDNRDDPEAVAAEWGTILANVRRRLRGQAPETIELATKKVLSNIHVRTAVAILSTDTPGTGLEAMEYYRDNAAEITAEDEAKLFNIIQPQFDNDLIEGAVGEVISGVMSTPPDAEPAPTPTAPREVKGSDYSPTAGIGRVSTEVAAHQRRGRTAKDYAAPEGTPIYPPTTGEVIEAPQAKRGANGYMVRIRHPNGYVTTYLHMRGPSPLKVGDQVGAGTIIGAVGNTGRSTGAHVDFSVKDAKGNVVNPDDVTWTAEDLPVHTAQRHDLESWYRKAHEVAMARGLNSRQYEQLLQRVDRHVGRQETLERRQQDEIDRQVMAKMAELDEELTDIGQIPNFGQASPTLQLQIKNMIAQNTRAREPEANSEIYYEIDGLAYGLEEEQQEFLSINPAELPITRAEKRAIQRRQNQIRGEIRESMSDSNTAASLNRVDATIRRFVMDPDKGKPLGFSGSVDKPEERRRFAALREIVARRVQDEQKRLGRDLTDVEMLGVVRNETLMMTVRAQTTFGTRTQTVPAYEVPTVREKLGENYLGTTIEVPPADVARIRAELAKRGRTNPSEAEILVWYRRSLIYQQR